MIRAMMYVANVPEDVTKEELTNHICAMADLASVSNIGIKEVCVVRDDFVVDLEEYIQLICEKVDETQIDSVVIDCSFGFEGTDNYDVLLEITNANNIALILYDNGNFYLMDSNEEFAYKTGTLEVTEYAPHKNNLQEFAAGIETIKEDFLNRLKELSPGEQLNMKREYAMMYSNIASIFIKESKQLMEELTEDIKRASGKKK